MGNCISDVIYHHDGMNYYDYCRKCDIYYSPVIGLKEKHCCDCKKAYYHKNKHCCFCHQSYRNFHLCECKFCTIQIMKTITKDDKHTTCTKCNKKCSYDHLCKV